MKHLFYLNKYLWKYKYRFGLSILFISLSNWFDLNPPQYVRESLNLVTQHVGPIDTELTSQIIRFGLMILGMVLLRGIFLFFTRQTVIVMSRLIENDLKNEIYKHYQTLPLSFYRVNNTGDLMARISEDVSRVRMYLGPALMYGANLIVMFLIYLPHMISISPKLTLYALLPLPFLSISIYYVSNKINKRSEEIQDSLSSMSNFVQEAFSGIRVLKSFVKEDISTNQFVKESENYRQKSLKLTVIQSLFLPLIMFLIGLSTVLAVYIGGTLVMKSDSNLSIGNIVEFLLYISKLTWPVTSLGWITSIIQRAAASQKRINEFLLTKTDIVSDENIKHEFNGNIEFNEVSFTYPESGIEAIKDISFSLKKGESVGIVGNTGSGKSSLANAICRLFDVSKGEILIDGISIKELDINYFRSQIGYVPQDVFLFSDTIKNNIAFGNSKHIEGDKIEQAAKDAGVYNNIINFPEGFETKVGERGITLSGGQKQRVSIARAIIRDPKIMVFDDCLSAVDTQTENEILGNLKRIMAGRTSIIISHRVSSVKIADKIILLDDGKLIEQGTHKDLMKLKGKYFELYEKQSTAEHP